MASTNKTELGLNQWLMSDKPTMEDFNADNVLVDENLTSVSAQIEKLEESINNKVSTSTSLKLTTQIAGSVTMDNSRVELITHLNQIQLSKSTNYDDIIDIGLYSVHAGAENAPNALHNTLLVTQSANNPSYVQQFAITQNGSMHLRVKNSGVWNGWKAINLE